MDLYMLALRLVHILSAVYWAGTTFYIALILYPAIKAAGPEGGRIMQAAMRPPMTTVMNVAASLAILSGILLLWRDSAGFRSEWIGTATGLAFTIGGAIALFAYLEGLFVSRPSGERMQAIGREVAAAGRPPTPAQMAEMQRLTGKLEKTLYRTAYMLAVSVIAMATARYL